jgi:short-subunit dehydrogenase
MSGRTVIVTGASSGIGEATARAFGRAGDRVVLVARRVDRLNQLAADLPESLVVAADLTRADDVARVAGSARARYGAIDVLVNNAGLGRYDWLERLSEDDILAQIQVNLMAPILLARAVLPTMQSQRRGVIINVCSVAGKIATPTTTIYNTTKFGLDGFSEALRRETGPQGVHVCVIYPAPVAGTEFGDHSRGPSLGGPRPGWTRTNTNRVAAAIVQMADRPRARRFIPGFYGAVVLLSAVFPSIVDAVLMRASRHARAAGTGS